MAYQYLTPDNLKERYSAAKSWTDALTEPFPEFERIARNRPHNSIDPAYPKTTDGTTASIIRKTPRRIIQQLPTGSVVSEQQDWLSIVADFIYNHKIIPHANKDYALLQKCWSVVENALAYGSTTTYTPFIKHDDGQFCSDLTIPFWGDVFLQPGKKSIYACDYFFMRAWWQKSDIEAKIEEVKKLGKGEKSTWDLGALNDIKDNIISKEEKAQSGSEKERKDAKNQGIELVIGFQIGVKAKFYTFAPGKGKDEDSVTIVRTKVNKDPRGKYPIDAMYGDTDGSNPLGRSVIDLVGSMQNLIDSDMQMYQYNRALMLAPPVIKRGKFNKARIRFAPNVIIDVGDDPNANVTPLNIDTSAVANFPALYSLQKSQLLNLLSSPDTSISATTGNPGFSKTPQGVQQLQANLSVDDNYIRKMFETWFENWSETAINMYFAERTGVEELQLDKQTAGKLRNLANFDPKLLSDDNKIRIDYDKAVDEVLTFRVDPSTTTVKDKAEQVQNATTLLDIAMKYPQLNSNFGGPIDIDELSRRIVINSGIDDPEQVAPEPTEAQKQAKEQAKQNPNPFSPMFDKPSIRINFPDIPPVAQVAILQAAGVPNITLNDVMGGPVADPNMRGVINPINDPNILIPGGGPAMQTPMGQAGMPTGQPGAPNPLQQDGINLTPVEIAKLQLDPRFAEGFQTAQSKLQTQPQPQQADPGAQDNTGLTPDHILKADQQAHQQEMDKAKFALEVQKTQQANQPQPPQPTDSQQPQALPQDQQQQAAQQLSPTDQALIEHMRQLGIPEQKIQQAMALLENGYSDQDVMQLIMGSAQQGAPVNG